MKIKNRQRLISWGDIESRKVLLEVLESTLHDLDGYWLIRNLLQMDEDILRIGDWKWDLRSKNRIFVVGAGKACNGMAKAVEEVVGDYVTEGVVIVKQIDPDDRLKRIELVVGGHPLPSTEGFMASQHILRMVDQSGPEDLFIGLISGGSSALMSCPVPCINLEDEISMTDLLLKKGVRMEEMNAIRRHISQTNGGRLAQKIEARGAEMINLVISDRTGDRPILNPSNRARYFGTPVAPDRTTLQDARNVLKKYDLYASAPPPIVEFLGANDPSRETPKSFGDRIHHFVMAGCADSCEAAKKAAIKKGLHPFLLTTFLEGESREAGTFFAAVSKEIVWNHRPLQPPCLLIASGETTTRVGEQTGRGGPSQELALGFALEISDLRGVSIAAIDTDGTDGPTSIAGGMADSTTVDRACLQGLDVYDYLKAHDSSNLLEKLGDEIITGNTGTNVCDLNIIYIP